MDKDYYDHIECDRQPKADKFKRYLRKGNDTFYTRDKVQQSVQDFDWHD